MKREYGYVEVHGSGFPLRTVRVGADRAEAVKAANDTYWAAVRTERAHGVRFGIINEQEQVRGKLVMTKSWSRYAPERSDPFA
jgi:hypothetical protein